MKKVVLFLVLVAVLSGCAQQGPDGNAGAGQYSNAGGVIMEFVENGDTVKVEYVGRFPDGEVFDKSEGRGPLEFVAGAGQMIAGFDEAVMGMKLNEEKTVTIPPEKAYGTADAGQRIEVPLEQIGGGAVEVGTAVYSSSGQQGTVIEIRDGIAVVEFIHPLAGKTLEFWINVVEMSKA